MNGFRFRRDDRPGGGPSRRLSYATVTATRALLVAVGGGSAWAAQHYVITSTGQIKPSVLPQLHGANGNNGRDGTDGVNGTAGINGVNGANGVNGVNGSNRANGAVAGYSAVNHVLVAATTDGTPTTDVTLALPAGDCQVSGKVTAAGFDTVAGGSVEFQCNLIDTPSGGSVATDTSYWADGLSVPSGGQFTGYSTLPLQLAVNSPNAASTVTLSCLTNAVTAGGGTGSSTSTRARSPQCRRRSTTDPRRRRATRPPARSGEPRASPV